MSSNPTPPMILVSFHESETLAAFEPVRGTALPGSVLDPSGNPLREPRGIYLDPGGNLLVIDGDKQTSAVYFYPKPTAPGGQYGPQFPLITRATADSIDHPFALAYLPGPLGLLAGAYVSNQDTNVVASFDLDFADPANPTATPSTPAPYLSQFGKPEDFLQGTWVASAKDKLPGVHGNPPVLKRSEGGLWAKIEDGKVTHSVRDVVYTFPMLLVADEAGQLVRLYEAATGNYLGHAALDTDPDGTLDSPTHILAVADTVYVSSANNIYSGQLQGGPAPGEVTLTLSRAFSLGSGTISGMAVDPDGNFYFADRVGKLLYGYSSDFRNQLWSPVGLSQQPEFVLYIGG